VDEQPPARTRDKLKHKKDVLVETEVRRSVRLMEKANGLKTTPDHKSVAPATHLWHPHNLSQNHQEAG
jgi:hypothetical protein